MQEIFPQVIPETAPYPAASVMPHNPHPGLEAVARESAACTIARALPHKKVQHITTYDDRYWQRSTLKLM